MNLLILEKNSGVATLTLNNPAERNTLTEEMTSEINLAMDDIESDQSIHAVIVTGAGSAFCAGANLGNLAAADSTALLRIYEGFLRIARSPLPTIAAVNGAAVGAGMNLALCCDLRIATIGAKFDTRFLQIGLHPGGGHTWMSKNIIGLQNTMAGVVFGTVVDGQEAERIGLIYKCVADDQLLATAMKFANRAAEVPRELLIAAKATILGMYKVNNHVEAVSQELGPQVWSAKQPWFAERISALQARIKKV